MSVTPPARRRLNPAVTVRRAQSERRYLSPWQLPWPLRRVSGPEPGRGPPWARVDHHHTPRTALIPPALPRMVGHSQTMLCDGMSPSGSVRHLPTAPVSSIQLPPIALGSPPVMLPPTHTLEDRLSQDRLSAFLAGEILPHRPRSILSCPESPLYESLVSIFNESEDAITIPDIEAEHDYQQIPVTEKGRRTGAQSQEGIIQEEQQKGRMSGSGNSPAGENQQGPPHQKMKVRKLNTLDVKPEKHCSTDEVSGEGLCTCQSGASPNTMWETLASHRVQPAGTSCSQSGSSQDSHKSAIYISTTPMVSDSEITDSEIYQEASLAPTVIHVSNSDKNSSQHIVSSSDSNSKSSNSKHTSGFFSSDNQQPTAKRFTHSSSSSSTSTNNYTATYTVNSGSDDFSSRVQVKAHTKPPDPVYPPLTIELSESKPPPWRPEQTRSTRNKSTQASLNTSSHVITTLDPPLKPGRHQSWFDKDASSQPNRTPGSRDATTLVVNFDSENSDNEDGPGSDSDSCSSTLAGSTSIYLTEDDTSSIYSSVAEIYSVLTSDSESLVYVYRPPPRRSRHRYSTLSYRFPSYAHDRGGSSGGSSGSGSSQEDTITFVEPTYRPSNLSVGSRGHLKIDYSWSWNRLDDFVRTTSPPRNGGGGRGGWDDLRYSTMPQAAPDPPVGPWERHLDPVAG